MKYFRTETDQSIQGYSSSLHGLIFIFNLVIFYINRFRNNGSHSILSVYYVPDALYRKPSLNVVDRLYTFKQNNVQQNQFSHRPIDMNKNEVPITSHQHNEVTWSETMLFIPAVCNSYKPETGAILFHWSRLREATELVRGYTASKSESGFELSSI